MRSCCARYRSSGPIDINSDFDANAIGVFNSVTDAKIDQTGIDIPVTVTASANPPDEFTT